jgi:hypothetical protein
MHLLTLYTNNMFSLYVPYTVLCLQGRKLAAFFAESVLGCAGQIVPPEGGSILLECIYI